jgi:hypothetical protein
MVFLFGVMMDKYLIKNEVLFDCPEIEIEKSNYEDIKLACEILKRSLIIEERYEIFLRNFVEIEKELLSISLSTMVGSEQSYSTASNYRIILNQRCINFFSSSRSYLDQSIKNDLAVLLGQDKDKLYKKIVYNLKKTNDVFEFIEELRNHVQHYGLPVHDYSTPVHWDREFKNCSFSSHFCVEKKKMANDTKMSKTRMFNVMPEKINILETIREYVNIISGIHDHIRGLLRCKVADSRHLIESIMKSYAQEYTEKISGLKVAHINDEKEIESVPLFLKWDDVRRKLEKKNYRINNMGKRFVTSKSYGS